MTTAEPERARLVYDNHLARALDDGDRISPLFENFRFIVARVRRVAAARKTAVVDVPPMVGRGVAGIDPGRL